MWMTSQHVYILKAYDVTTPWNTCTGLSISSQEKRCSASHSMEWFARNSESVSLRKDYGLVQPIFCRGSLGHAKQ